MNIGHKATVSSTGSANAFAALQYRASGGFVDAGQMFVAREAGPELVGSIGNKTAVANNNQIVDAVAKGVASAVAGVMGSGSEKQTIEMNVDGNTFARAVVSSYNRLQSQSGNVLFNI